MKLLRDEYLYCIKVDYFMYSEEKGEYNESMYLSIDTETKRKDGKIAGIIIFKETINKELRVFDTERDAEDYLEKKGKETCCYTNGRVIKIRYNFENNTWEEM